jgi:hypothetical protein
VSTKTFAIAAAVLAVVAVPATAVAGGKHGGNSAAAGGCTVSGRVVSVTGLPTDQVVNFMVTTAAGTTGWVLGFTPDGTWSVDVPAADGATTYEFVSRTFGPAGSKYSVFASCSA